jgi:Fur family transcriptional regulator, zinc uptake regulator
MRTRQLQKTTRQNPPGGHGHTARHNHRKCVSDAVSAADRICQQNGARLTPLRRRVLELVWTSHAPVGAYELLELMAAEDSDSGGGRPAPPTVYRALDFLKAQGLVHRIETLNAFVGCAHPEAPHDAQYLICEACGNAVELEIDGLAGQIRKAAAREGFAVGAQTIEVQGRCGDCVGLDTRT